MEELTVEGYLEGNIIKIKNPPRALFIFKDKELEVTIQPLSHKRSDAQNRFYRGPVLNTIHYFLKESQGEKYDKDEIHEYNIRVVMGVKPEKMVILGEEVLVTRFKRTSEMTKFEFSNFIEHITAHFGTMGCTIPEPLLMLK